MTAAQRTTVALGAALMLLAAGCGKNEILSGGESDIPMQFRTYSAGNIAGKVSTATKADASLVEPGETTLPAGSTFGVFAFYQEGVMDSYTGAWDDFATKNWKPDYMFDQDVDFDGTDYTYTPIRYWPSNSENTISFWAYYPYNAYRPAEPSNSPLKFYDSNDASYDASSIGLPVAEYTVDTDPDKQKDIMFAALQKDKTYYNTTDGIVPLTFSHALALVEFVLAEGTNAEITSFEVTNLYWKGTCSNPGATPIVWTGQTDAGNFTLSNVTLSGSSTIARLIMMPQTLDAGANLSITYDIHFASYDPYHPDDIVYAGNSGSALLSTAGIAQWEAGKHYVYKISAGFERIEFESAVATDWSIGNDNITVN